jgi:hypothetical protein
MSVRKPFVPHEWGVSALFVSPVSRGDRRIRAGPAQDQPKIRSGLLHGSAQQLTPGAAASRGSRHRRQPPSPQAHNEPGNGTDHHDAEGHLDASSERAGMRAGTPPKAARTAPIRSFPLSTRSGRRRDFLPSSAFVLGPFPDYPRAAAGTCWTLFVAGIAITATTVSPAPIRTARNTAAEAEMIVWGSESPFGVPA